MSTTPVTLDSIRAATEAKYGSYPIALDAENTTVLRNPLRCSKEEREQLMALQTELADLQDEDGEVDVEAAAKVDQAELFRRMIRVVSETQGQADRLLSLVGDDLALLAQIMEGYQEGTQLGEASASAA